jgi:hypothetical protein
MVFNATNISVISWRSTDKSLTNFIWHIMLYTSPWSRFKLTTSVVIGTDCIGSCKSNYHTIMATMTPRISVNMYTVWYEEYHIIIVRISINMCTVWYKEYHIIRLNTKCAFYNNNLRQVLKYCVCAVCQVKLCLSILQVYAYTIYLIKIFILFLFQMITCI